MQTEPLDRQPDPAITFTIDAAAEPGDVLAPLAELLLDLVEREEPPARQDG